MSSLFDPDGPGEFNVDAPPPSTDPVCEVCGKPLTYSGRGRRPRFCDDHKTKTSSSGTSSRSRVSESELTNACNSLHQLYDMLTFPVAAVNPEAAAVWLEQIPPLDARNRTILANNRDLVRKINSAGEKGGTLAFMLSHMVAIGPVALMVAGQLRVNAADRRAAREAERPDFSVPAEDFAFTRPPNANVGGVGGAFFDPDLASPAG